MSKLFLFFVSTLALAALEPSAIPREPGKKFLSEGLFQGGSPVKANIEALRFAKHKKEGFERWVFDFSDEKHRIVGRSSPQFQIRLIQADRISNPDGSDIVLSPSKLVVSFRAIHENFVTRSVLAPLLKKSDRVKDIVLYPPIEDGDTSIEFVLKDSVKFEAHQPLQNEGRLVVDLR